jgi:uncharacterized membrane protein YhhN
MAQKITTYESASSRIWYNPGRNLPQLINIRPGGLDMTVAVVAGALFAADVALHIAFIAHGKETLRCLTKALLMPLLVVSFVLLWSTYSTAPLPWLVPAGMLAGCAGDISLFDHHHPVGVPLGLAFFSVGHVLYLMQMFRLMAMPAWWLIAAAAAVYGAGAAITYKRLWPYLPKPMRIPALFYMLLLCVLSAAAALAAFSTFRAGAFVLLAGTLLLIWSDAKLSFEMYRGETRHTHIKIMIPYIAAQTLIAAGFFLWMARLS